MMRRVNAETVALVKRYEGLHRKLPDGSYAPYLCPANVWTIYAGATRGLDGQPVSRATAPITAEQGEGLLARDLRAFEASVTRLVRVPLTDNQFGALVSFAFNLGAGRLQSSSLLRHTNNGRFDLAADEFGKWVMGGGQRLPGLVLRRDAERRLFLTPDPQEPPSLPNLPRGKTEAISPLHRFILAFHAVK
jgi:lysozyme